MSPQSCPQTRGKGTQNLPRSSLGRKCQSSAHAPQLHIAMGFAVADSHRSQKSDRFTFNQIKHLLLTEHISAQPGQASQRAVPTGGTSQESTSEGNERARPAQVCFEIISHQMPVSHQGLASTGLALAPLAAPCSGLAPPRMQMPGSVGCFHVGCRNK